MRTALESSAAVRATASLLLKAGFVATAYFTVSYCFHTPSPGKAVTVLGVAAVIMSLREGMPRIEKAAWIGMVFLLLFVELRAINKDREENQANQPTVRAEERKSFQGVLDQGQQNFEAGLAQGRSNFEGTVSKLVESQKSERREFSALLKKDNDLFIHEEQLSESLNGKLIPGNEPTPPNHCGAIPQGFAMLLFGTSAIVTNKFPHSVLYSRSLGPVLTLEREEENGPISVVMDIRGSDNKIIARLNSSGFVVNRNNYLQMRKDKSSLEVIDEYGAEVLTARYLNPQTFLLNGTIRYPGRDPVPLQIPGLPNICFLIPLAPNAPGVDIEIP